MVWIAERSISMVAAIVDLCIEEQSADNRAVLLGGFEITTERNELCILGLLVGVGQLVICFWSRRRIGYRIHSLCCRKPSPRLRQDEELDVVRPPCI